MPVHRTLRDLLLEEGLADASTLEAGEQAARRLGCAFVVALLEERLVEAPDVLELLRRRVSLPEADLDRILVEPDAIREVPLSLAEHHRLLPLAMERHAGRPVMRVAMADPLDAAAIEEIEFTTGCRVEPVLALATDIAAAVKRHYRGVVTKVMRGEAAAEAADPPRPAARRPAAPTPPRGPAETLPPTAAGGGAAAAAAPPPHTQPAHRLEDEASAELRIRALINALVRRGLVGEEDYLQELSELLKLRSARED